MTDTPAEEGSTTWESRKAKVKARYYQTLSNLGMADEAATTPGTPGSAPSKAVDLEVFSVMAGVPPSASSGTSATATAPSETPIDPRASTTPAVSTSSDSEPSTVWMESPLGFNAKLLKPSIVGPNGRLIPGLPPSVHASLHTLAAARSEPVEEVVQQIVDFFIEEEDERAEGTLHDALVFYMTNYGAPV